ncbi:S1 family peptidase [Saccharopolyspora sp. 5N708]|uniref:S1 family peptidase n=1 Tax=Saccharopolyspora sp. 5N708 TaxID=3457424 RepID=UPI003FD60E02
MIRKLLVCAAMLGFATISCAGPPDDTGSASAGPENGVADTTVSPGVLPNNIVGGGNAVEKYPFMAEITNEAGNEHSCGGALIAPNWVATAAHCFINDGGDVPHPPPPPSHVRIGSNDRTSGGKLVKIAEVIGHPEFEKTPGHDVLLLRLSEAVDYAPAKIGTSAAAGTQVRALGWGQTCPGYTCPELPEQLKQLDTKILDDAKCTKDDFVGATEVCVDATTSATPCFGDSGGPLLTKADGDWRLLGVTSRGSAYTCGEGPEIYTDLGEHLAWINQTIGTT